MPRFGDTLIRRDFLAGLALGAAALASARCRSIRPSKKRPNILFCITDDQSYPHASAYGCRFVKTPAFDRVAREGVLFHNAFVSAPSCCPSRASVLTGQDFYRLKEASMNHTVWPSGMATYMDLLAGAAYTIGFTGKGWGSGNWQASGRSTNPAGPAFNEKRLSPPQKGLSDIDYAANFQAFLDQKLPDAPFSFWVGFLEPHRGFDPGIGDANGIAVAPGQVPAFLPDVSEVRRDLADYAFEIEQADRQLGRILDILERRGELDNTLVVVTADNGMAFPGAKATLYDAGTRMPLAVRWGKRIRRGRIVWDFVCFTDFAPTFLEAAGLPIPAETTGKSLIPILESRRSGQIDLARDHAVFGLERHFPGARPDGAGYPMRAIRTSEYLYIRNLKPESSPVGDRPGPVWPADDPVGGYGDIDGGPTKTFMWERRDQYADLSERAFGRRPAEELYDVGRDPDQLHNLAANPEFARIKTSLAGKLDAYLKRTGDPRALDRGWELDAVMKRFPE